MEYSVLKDILIIFALSSCVNFIFTKIKVPTVIGYLFTGVVAGPHLLRLISSQTQIDLMADIGVILLLFSIGMEFSLKHLMKIRRVVFFGGLLQVLLTAGGFYIAACIYGMDWKGSLFAGLIAALSSSALVLKVLQERSEITSNYGRTVVGILIFQDIMLVPLLLFTDILGSGSANLGNEIFLLTIKTIGIIAFVYVGNKWLFPKLLQAIAMTKNQELFMMSILVICLGVAFLTSALGMSLAFGAFLAGLMISDSQYSNNVFGNLVTFKDTFTSFFFVSIGMMLDLSFVAQNWHFVLIAVIIVVLVKTIIGGGVGMILGHTLKGSILVGLALCQVGEFSFILAKLGSANNIISDFFYHLFLSVAVITMALSPFVIQVGPFIAKLFLKLPLPKKIVEGLFPLKEIEIPELSNHLVIIGKDTAALKLSQMARQQNIPYITIVFDPALVKTLQKTGETVIYGDAVNLSILEKAHVDTASIVVISVGDLIPAMSILDKTRQLNPSAYIIVRAKKIVSMGQLYSIGADQVVPEKLETAIDLFRRVLSHQKLPQREVNRVITNIRDGYYGVFREKDPNKPTLFEQMDHSEINSIVVAENSEAANHSLADLKLRNRTGATLLSIKRNNELIEQPSAATMFLPGDIAYLLGNPDQLEKVREIFVTSKDE